LRKEVTLYAEKNVDFDYEAWYQQYKAQPSLIDLQALPLLTAVAYNIAWQKRSSRNCYDSHSGHAIPVGVFTNLPVGLTVMNKHCRICFSNEEPTDHDCLANFEGSSGAMESAALVLVQLAHCLHFLMRSM
jgi:hypothetical protein